MSGRVDHDFDSGFTGMSEECNQLVENADGYAVDCGLPRSSHQPAGTACYDCGLPYGEPGWCDTHIPTDMWAKISPTDNEGGLLCITCMARSLEALGLQDVPLMVTSGPWSHEPEQSYQEGWARGHAVAMSEARELIAATVDAHIFIATYPMGLYSINVRNVEPVAAKFISDEIRYLDTLGNEVSRDTDGAA